MLPALSKLPSLGKLTNGPIAIEQTITESYDPDAALAQVTRTVKTGGRSTGNDNYLTPPEFLEIVRQFAPIDLDPCGADGGSFVEAKREFLLSRGEDGLTTPWDVAEGEVAFVNCPYGRQVATWIERCDEVYRQSDDEILLLIAARTETIAVQASTAAAICFLKGRLTFLDPVTKKPPVDANGKPTAAMFPSMVMYYGDRTNWFSEVFSPHGKCVLWR